MKKQSTCLEEKAAGITIETALVFRNAQSTFIILYGGPCISPWVEATL